MKIDLPTNLRHLAETLEPPKPGIIVGIATERLVRRGHLPDDAHECLSLPDWRAFCHAVWHAEMPGECNLITRHTPSITGELIGGRAVHNCEYELSPHLRPIIEVDDRGLTQLAALHQIAHVLVDMDFPGGHRLRFIGRFVELINRWISPIAASDWYAEWTAALRWADEHEGWPPAECADGNPS